MDLSHLNPPGATATVQIVFITGTNFTCRKKAREGTVESDETTFIAELLSLHKDLALLPPRNLSAEYVGDIYVTNTGTKWMLFLVK